MSDLPTILTRKEVAKLFKISTRSLDYLIAAKEIPYKKVGKRSVRFDAAKLAKWFDQSDTLNVPERG